MGQDAAEALIPGPDNQAYGKQSPDGRWILYWSWPRLGTTEHLMRLPASGGSPEQVLENSDDTTTHFDCPSDPASSCVLSHWGQGQLAFYSLDPVQGQGKQLATTKLAQPNDLGWSISPDGLRIAIQSRDKLREQVRIIDLAHGTEHDLHLPHEWFIWSLSWARDGTALFAAAQSTDYMIVRIDADGKIGVLLDKGRDYPFDSPVSSQDGRHLAFSQWTFERNIWLLENF